MRGFARIALGVLVTVWSCSFVEAAVFTAGLGGTYPTIQGAIDAAIAAGGDNFIKIRGSSFSEFINVPASMTSGSLTLSGGWNAFFTSRNPDPASTVIHSPADGTAVTIQHAGGTVRFDGITLTGNNPTGDGGALFALLFGDARLVLDHCVITDSSTGERGGGGLVSLHDTAGFELFDCVVSNNLALKAGGTTGGGLHLYLTGSSTGRIAWSTIEDNSIQTAGNSGIKGGGIYLQMLANAQFEIVDSVFSNNILGPTSGVRYGSDLHVTAYAGAPEVELRRNRFQADTSGAGLQTLYLGLASDATAAVSDSWFWGGSQNAVTTEIADSGRLYFNNNTVTEFGSRALFFGAYGTQFLISVTNNIVWNNGVDDPYLPPGAITSGNLVGVDPIFVDPPRRNYRLNPGSPAIDIATGIPAGGLSAVDLHNLVRVMGSAVDAGASEWSGLFGDGFEVGTVRMWSH